MSDKGMTELRECAAEIKRRLESYRGWGPHSYFSHSGGQVSLGSASKVWEIAHDLAGDVVTTVDALEQRNTEQDNRVEELEALVRQMEEKQASDAEIIRAHKAKIVSLEHELGNAQTAAEGVRLAAIKVRDLEREVAYWKAYADQEITAERAKATLAEQSGYERGVRRAAGIASEHISHGDIDVCVCEECKLRVGIRDDILEALHATPFTLAFIEKPGSLRDLLVKAVGLYSAAGDAGNDHEKATRLAAEARSIIMNVVLPCIDGNSRSALASVSEAVKGLRDIVTDPYDRPLVPAELAALARAADLLEGMMAQLAEVREDAWLAPAFMEHWKETDDRCGELQTEIFQLYQVLTGVKAKARDWLKEPVPDNGEPEPVEVAEAREILTELVNIHTTDPSAS